MSKKWDNLLVPKLQYCQFEPSQIAEKKQNLSHEWKVEYG